MIALALSYLLIGTGILVAAVLWRPAGFRTLLIYLFSAVFFVAFLFEFVIPSAGALLAFLGAAVVFLVVIAFSHGTIGKWVAGYINAVMVFIAVCLWEGSWCFIPFTGILFGMATLWGVKVGAILHWEHRNVLALSAALFFLSTALHVLNRPLAAENMFFSGTVFGILQLFEGAEILKGIQNRRRLFNKVVAGRRTVLSDHKRD